MRVREVRPGDAERLAVIYDHYVLNSHSTFEVDPIEVAEMASRIGSLSSDGYPFYVAEAENRISGYAYAHRYRERPAYSRTVEVSVYVAPENTGQGIGRKLYEILIPKLAERGFHAVIAGISLPNEASVNLHERFRFERVAHFLEVGLKFGRWIDVGYWELVLENDRTGQLETAE